MKPMDILVLFGGCSTEYGVSLESAHAVLSHMDPEKYRPIPVGITRDGAWYWYPGPLEAIPKDRWQENPACVPCTLRLDRGNCWTEVDRKFPLQLFSRYSTARMGRTAPSRDSLSWRECR